jgi:hypothetical protein
MMDSRSSLHTTLPSRDGLCSGGGGGKNPEMSASVSDVRDVTPPFWLPYFIWTRNSQIINTGCRCSTDLKEQNESLPWQNIKLRSYV